MHLTCLSLHHLKLRYADFEKLKFRDPAEFYEISKEISERVLLQTNTRFEIYALVDGREKAKSLLNTRPSRIKKDLFKIYLDGDAALHLFRLACGIESRVLGETNLPAQIEDAFRFAEESGAVDTFMGALFGAAINTGRRARSETRIEGTIPLAEVAVRKILQELPALTHKKVLLMGAGLTGLKAALIMAGQGADLIVINKNYDAATRVAKEVGGRAIEHRRLREALSTADVLICATLASHYRVTVELLKSVERESSLVIVDLSPFGNVDPAVAALPNVILKNGELRRAVQEDMEMKKAEVPKVEKIVEEEIERWRSSIGTSL